MLYVSAPTALQHSICEEWRNYSRNVPLTVCVGNYNINGGKHFKSVVFKDASLGDWLTDLNNADQVDIYAVGFEEMVDLDTKNIVNTSGENARLWCQELLATLNKNTSDQFSLVTYTQLVGVCLYVFIRSKLSAHVRDVFISQVNIQGVHEKTPWRLVIEL